VVHGTGGLYDTLFGPDAQNATGNGLGFDDYEPNALRWGVDRAMEFSPFPMSVKEPQPCHQGEC
jgi:glycogen synthase